MSETEQIIEQPTDTEVSPEALEKAKNLGYVPPEDWKGDPPPGGFKSPEQFLEDGEKNIAIQRQNMDKLHSELREMRDSFQDLKAMYAQKSETDRQKAYDEAYNAIVAKQAQAIDEQDSEAFAKAENEKRELQETAQKEAQQSAQSTAQDAQLRAMQRYVDKNPWAASDYVLSTELQQAGNWLRQTQPNIAADPDTYLEEAGKLVRQKFPDHPAFADQSPPRTPDGGTQIAGGGSRAASGETWQNLPQDAKDAFNRYVKQGLYQDTNESRKEYMEVYYG
jgi:hypothetical protein